MEWNQEECTFIEHMAQGLAAWEDFPAGGRALVVGDAPGMAELCRARGMMTTEATADAVMGQMPEGVEADDVASLAKEHDAFDIVLMVAEPERVKAPVALLSACRKLLSPHGRLLLGMNNRFGLRYFCGDADIYTDRSFDGLDDYKQVYKTEADGFFGRTYSRTEIRQMLADAGFSTQKFYAVLPDLEHPMMLFADGQLPLESLKGRLFPMYHRPEHVFLLEERLHETIMAEGLFHVMANAYFVECPLDGKTTDVLHVTSSLDRKPKDALLTVIRGADGTPKRVEKLAAFPEGEVRLQEIIAHHQDLRAHGLQTVEDRVANGVYQVPFLTAPTALMYFRDVLRKKDRAAFFAALDKFRECILASSEHVSEGDGKGHGVVLARGYFDLVPINAFFMDGTFVFFDQEFMLENCPADVMLLRTLSFLCQVPEMQGVTTWEELSARYGLEEERVGKLWKMINPFLNDLRQVARMMPVRAPHERDGALIEANRMHCAYPEQRYRALFVDIFAGLEEKELVVFGSGKFATQFLDGYGGRYPVAHVVDNSPERQGQEIGGHRIESPEILRELSRGSFKVIICVKGYLGIARQLYSMGIEDYACFDPAKDYPSARPIVQVQAAPAKEEAAPKKYHIGYVAGVFDLFHQGHLNLLRRAKAQCDMLVVGVVADEGVRRFKRVEPFIPEDERLSIVRACRYVDQAELLPVQFAGIRDAWHLFHFDVMFTGSDYQENAGWLSDKEFLKRNGADLVFFPYTESTSSTRIKSLIQKKLL